MSSQVFLTSLNVCCFSWGLFVESGSMVALPYCAITVVFDFSRLIRLEYGSDQTTLPFPFFLLILLLFQ